MADVYSKWVYDDGSVETMESHDEYSAAHTFTPGPMFMSRGMFDDWPDLSPEDVAAMERAGVIPPRKK